MAVAPRRARRLPREGQASDSRRRPKPERPQGGPRRRGGSRRLGFVLVLAALVLGLTGALHAIRVHADGQVKPWNRDRAQLEYERIQAEMVLVKTDKPYLVLDLSAMEVQIKQAGVLLWNSPLALQEGRSDSPGAFSRRFQGDNAAYVRPLLAKHLYEASHKTPEEIMKIVSEVNRTDVALMQRDVPERLAFYWADDLVLDIRSENSGEPRDKKRNTLLDIRRWLQKPLGEAQLVVTMPADRALTLNHCLQPGYPTLIIPAG